MNAAKSGYEGTLSGLKASFILQVSTGLAYEFLIILRVIMCVLYHLSNRRKGTGLKRSFTVLYRLLILLIRGNTITSLYDVLHSLTSEIDSSSISICFKMIRT